ncbi:unnamed protein product, partial [Scytosiphon promiscuus]
GKNHFTEVQCRSMVSLEELVALLTRGAPDGAFPHGGATGIAVDTTGDAAAEGKEEELGDAPGGIRGSFPVAEDAKGQREMGSSLGDDVVAEAKEREAEPAAGRVGGGGGGSGGKGGGGVEEQKKHRRPLEQRQSQRGREAGYTNDGAVPSND